MKAAFFDIGGVVIKDVGLKAALFEAFSPVSQELVWNSLNTDVLPACKGGVALADCWKLMAKKFGVQLSEARANSLWIEDFRAAISVDHGVMEIVNSLKAQGIALGVISNTIHEHAVILDELGVYAPFEHVVLSHQVGMTKDTQDIFVHALSRAKVKPQEALFVDDVQTFVDCAQKVGMRALLFRGADKLRADVAALVR